MEVLKEMRIQRVGGGVSPHVAPISYQMGGVNLHKAYLRRKGYDKAPVSWVGGGAGVGGEPIMEKC